jgi:hypothetical protein
VKVPLVRVVVFRRYNAAIKHGKIDGIFHFPDFAPREIVRETRSRCHRLLLSVLVSRSLSLSVPQSPLKLVVFFRLWLLLSLFFFLSEEEEEEEEDYI